MQRNVFVISLDFELMWGVRDKRTIAAYGQNIRGARTIVPMLLQLFERYDIRASFATVGLLFAKTKEEMLRSQPAHKPHYRFTKYSPYEHDYFSSIGESETEDIYHFANSLIELIRQSPQQEIASHTFSHYYCLENASLLSFEEDLLAAKAIAVQYGVELKSLVFPRNQYSQAHIDICKKLGFLAFRGNPHSRVYDPRKNEEQNNLLRATRLADAYLNLTGHHTFQPKNEGGIVNVPASAFLRPYSSQRKWAEGLRLGRIKNSMTYAARNNQSYHLWWHPHNFGVHPNENLAFLEEILKHYQQLHHHYGMQSKTMRAIAEEILQPHAV